MRRYYAAAFLAVTAAAVGLTPTAAAYINPPTPPAMFAVERESPMIPVTDAASVLIIRPDSLGSGFYIGNGLIGTAAHVVKGAKTVTIKTEDGRISSARVVAINDDSDVAILRTSQSHMLAARMNCGVVPVGTDIVSYGNPMGLEFVATYGRIAGAPRELGGRLSYVTDMTTVMGQSGGPVFANGRVIGVTSAVMIAPFELVGGGLKDGNGIYSKSIVGLGFVVPSSVVCKMLDGIKGEGV